MNAQRLTSEASPVPDLVPVQQARSLVGGVATQTIFSLGVRGELEVRQVAGRFVVTRQSIEEFRRRRGIK